MLDFLVNRVLVWSRHNFVFSDVYVYKVGQRKLTLPENINSWWLNVVVVVQLSEIKVTKY